MSSGNKHMNTKRSNMRKSLYAVLVFLVSASPVIADSSNPSVVTNVSASALSNTEVSLSWNRPNDNVGVVGYNLYRDDQYFRTIFSSTTYTDRGLSTNTQYSYYVVAFDQARNYSTKSASAVVFTGDGTSGTPRPTTQDGKPGTPTTLQAQVQSDTQVYLTWQQPSGYVEGYNLYRNGSYFKTVFGSTNYLDNALSPGNTYRFQIAAFGNGEYSSTSSPVTVTTGSQTAPPPPAPDAGNGSVPQGYSLVFSDEFNGGSIDSSKWNTSYRWGADWVINNEQQYYVDTLNDPGFGHSPFYVNGGTLTISAIRTPGNLRSKARNQPYLSGAMTTFNKFRMQYGYVEMRAKLPRGKGLWPAFWLLHQHNSGIRPEIDVMELLGDDSRMVYQTYHYFDNGTLRSTPSFQAPGPDYASDFHTFGMKWEPGRITWYVDGQETNRYESGNVASEEMYLLMNLALGGSWAGSPDGSTAFPASYTIDYVRAYQRR